MKFTIYLFAICLITFRGSAQTLPLKIGDKVPDIYLGSFLNSTQKRLKISDLKGKLIILDFWNIRCTVCISGMPKMDSIQKKFGSQVQIIAVTHNNENEVKDLFSRIKFKVPGFPFIIRDTVFNTLFPHAGDPLHVWINPDGVVSAITNHYNTNNETIGKFLSGGNPQLSRRWDFGFNTDYPFLSEQNSSLLSYASFYSTLFHGLEEASGGNFIRVTNNLIQTTNSSILKLYSIAYYDELYGFKVNHFDIRNDNRVIIEAKDKSHFIMPANEDKVGDWIKENVFSYELKVPDDKKTEKFTYMQQDLKRYFPYSAEIKKRDVKSLVLINNGSGKQILEKDTSLISVEGMQRDKSFLIQNMPITTLISNLIYANPNLTIPIVDDTGFKFNITVKLKSRLSNLSAVNLELNSLGLSLVERVENIDMLVIRDR